MGKVVTGTGQAFQHVPDVFTGLNKVGTPAPTTGPGAQQSLERPRSIVGIVDVGSQIAGNVWGMLALLGLVSFSLGLINLLPILPFDGGHAAVVALRVGRLEGPAPPRAGRLPQARAGHHGVHGAVPGVRALDDPARRAGRDRRLLTLWPGRLHRISTARARGPLRTGP